MFYRFVINKRLVIEYTHDVTRYPKSDDEKPLGTDSYGIK